MDMFVRKIVIALLSVIFIPIASTTEVFAQKVIKTHLLEAELTSVEIDTASIKRFGDEIYVHIRQKPISDDKITAKKFARRLSKELDAKVNRADSIDSKVIYSCDTRKLTLVTVEYAYDWAWMVFRYEDLSRGEGPGRDVRDLNILPGSRDEEILDILCTKHRYENNGDVHELYLEEIPPFLKKYSDARPVGETEYNVNMISGQ